MRCNLCGGGDFALIHRGNMDTADLTRFAQYACHGDVKRCNRCGLYMQELEHGIDQLIEMIKRETYSDDQMDSFILEDKRHQFDMPLRFMEGWMPLAGKSFLDVGANTGLFLERVFTFSDSIRAIEPSREAAQIARERLGDVVENATVMETKLPDAYFDIITMWDVIEHLGDPISDLRHLTSALRSGGMIFISTHDVEGWFAKATGRYYPLLMYQHFYHFSLRTLTDMLESVGLEVLGHKYFSKSWSIAYLHSLIDRLYPNSRFARRISELLKPIAAVEWIGRMRVVMPTGNNFIIVAQRPVDRVG